METKLTFRFADRSDTGLILFFIRKLAEYEKKIDEVVATEESLGEWIFDKQRATVMFALLGGKEIGFTLYFYNFSTFLGKAGLYIEDLFLLPEFRRRGYGRLIFAQLAKIAAEQGCGRIDWWCLDWNRPSIDFYLSLQAKPMEEWTVYRLTGDALRNLAEAEPPKRAADGT